MNFSFDLGIPFASVKCICEGILATFYLIENLIIFFYIKSLIKLLYGFHMFLSNTLGKPFAAVNRGLYSKQVEIGAEERSVEWNRVE